MKELANNEEYKDDSLIDYIRESHPDLKEKQYLFIAAYIANSGKIMQSCKDAGITNPTYRNWKKNKNFFEALNSTYGTVSRSLVPKALQVVQNALDNDDLKAAELILKHQPEFARTLKVDGKHEITGDLNIITDGVQVIINIPKPPQDVLDNYHRNTNGQFIDYENQGGEDESI